MKTNVGGVLPSLFVEEPELNLLCGICEKVSNDPHTCKNGDCFCLSCISESLTFKTYCPICFDPTDVEALSKNCVAQDIIHHLDVMCGNRHCLWIGCLEERISHVISCPYQSFSCPLNDIGKCPNCQGNFTRAELEVHVWERSTVETVLALINQIKTQQTQSDVERPTNKIQDTDVIEKKPPPEMKVLGADNTTTGDVYRGGLVDGKRHGYGTIIHSEDSVFVFCSGDFSADQLHGEGFVQFRDGSSYRGGFLHGLFDGLGVRTWTSGLQESYTGRFVQSRRCGKGRMIFRDGSCYNGMFSGDLFHGRGTYAWATGIAESYMGDWRAGQYCGHGVMMYRDGSHYDGHWKAGEREGRGTYVSANGDQYRGGWKDSMQHGEGVVEKRSGFIGVGLWEDGIYVSR
jgi:hypothetical protein